MGENKFLAKSTSNSSLEETIQEHTLELLKQFKIIKDIYPNIKNLNWDILKLACIYHDLGKMNTKFQIKLGSNLKDDLKDLEEVHHGYLSPAFLPKKYLESIYSDEELKILYQSIFYHHARHLLDNYKLLRETIDKDLSKYMKSFEFEELLDSEGLNNSYKKRVKNRITSQDEELFYKYIITKGLLNKIDYSASAHIPVEVESVNLYEKTVQSIEGNGFKLNDLQEYMCENQDENNIIIASTGIGKTEGALLWIGNNKGFFTLPLKVSINAIYDRVISESKINFDKDKAGLLHSDTLIEYLNREKEEELEHSRLTETKQLSLPLTICTLDQLIDFVFKYPGFEVKLATLAYSKLVIDEIQMYSPDMIGHLLVALKYVHDMGGKFSIVTATLPGIIVDFLKELGVKFKVPEKPFIKRDIKTGEYQIRHRMKVLERNLNVSDILSPGYENKKILVIANTVKEAQSIYRDLKDSLPNGFNINLLHSRFIRKHRQEKESAILDMGNLASNETGIWVSTQIVEASLDIDFDVLYTELSDVSGLFQRMGRVYRNRSLEGEDTNIYVYVGDRFNYPSGIKESKNRSIIDIDIFKLSKEAIMMYNDDIITELDKIDIVEKVYSKENLKNTDYYKKIKETINSDLERIDFDLKKGEEKLRDIDSTTIIPICIYKENIDEIQEVLSKLKSSNDRIEREILKNKIKDYTVSVDSYRVMNVKAYETLHLSRFERIDVFNLKYSKEMGLEYEKGIDV